MEGWEQPGGSQEFERGLRKVAQRGGTFFLFSSPSSFPSIWACPSMVAGGWCYPGSAAFLLIGDLVSARGLEITPVVRLSKTETASRSSNITSSSDQFTSHPSTHTIPAYPCLCHLVHSSPPKKLQNLSVLRPRLRLGLHHLSLLDSVSKARTRS